MKGKLYLIPAPLGENAIHTIPEYVKSVIRSLDIFIVERGKTARKYLKETGITIPLQEMTFFELNKHTTPEEFSTFLNPIEEGKNIGLLSEAGVPGVADPGGEVVTLAHQKGIEVLPLVGPSSILLALMASGLNGQNFAFCGYLPIKQPARKKELIRLEQHALKTGETKIIIETPYRNNSFIKEAIDQLSTHTYFCIAADISLQTQYIRTKTVKNWRKTTLPDLSKKPAIYLIGKPVLKHYRQ